MSDSARAALGIHERRFSFLVWCSTQQGDIRTQPELRDRFGWHGLFGVMPHLEDIGAISEVWGEARPKTWKIEHHPFWEFVAAIDRVVASPVMSREMP